jgi:hypothetical protein
LIVKFSIQWPARSITPLLTKGMWRQWESW